MFLWLNGNKSMQGNLPRRMEAVIAAKEGQTPY
jgi:hypothetical protein